MSQNSIKRQSSWEKINIVWNKYSETYKDSEKIYVKVQAVCGPATVCQLHATNECLQTDLNCLTRGANQLPKVQNYNPLWYFVPTFFPAVWSSTVWSAPSHVCSIDELNLVILVGVDSGMILRWPLWLFAFMLCLFVFTMWLLQLRCGICIWFDPSGPLYDTDGPPPRSQAEAQTVCSVQTNFLTQCPTIPSSDLPFPCQWHQLVLQTPPPTLTDHI